MAHFHQQHPLAVRGKSKACQHSNNTTPTLKVGATLFLLTRVPVLGNQIAHYQAARLKTFLDFTTDAPFYPCSREKTALEAWNHLRCLVLKGDPVNFYHRLTLPTLESEASPAQYISNFWSRYAQLVSADSEHYLASAQSLVSDILSGLPQIMHVKLIRT